jgi:hypothetical protein
MTDLCPSPPKIISFGFRCSSAALLKQMNLKTESYPFDWLVSDLSVIHHCMETDFVEFENPAHYERRYTNTYEMADSREGFICDEHLMVNCFYQPPHLFNEENTYRYKLAMNHHNILESKDADYYHRCIQRFRELMENQDIPKIYLHIRHLVTLETYEKEKETILKEFADFDQSIQQRYPGSLKGLFFILVKDKKEFREHRELLLETPNGSHIWILYVNRDFVDAGETFMGNFEKEVLFLKNEIQHFLSK